MSSSRPNVSRQPVTQSQGELRQEVEHHLQTLHDLGPEYTDSVAVALADRMDALIEEKVRLALAGQGGRRSNFAERQRFVLLILALSIPLLAIGGGIAGTLGILGVAAVVMVITLVAMTHNF